MYTRNQYLRSLIFTLVFRGVLWYNILGGENYGGEVRTMAVSYKKLWKLLIDRDLLKRDLCRMAHISGASMAKLGKGENVHTDILLKICCALKCDISDIMEVTHDEPVRAEVE
jgi:DNA-binding Xre family transcriptional regulator